MKEHTAEIDALADALYADGDLGPGYMFRDDCEHLASRVLVAIGSLHARAKALVDEFEKCGDLSPDRAESLRASLAPRVIPPAVGDAS